MSNLHGDGCPGHGPNVWDTDVSPDGVTYCDGICVTDEATSADEEPDMIR